MAAILKGMGNFGMGSFKGRLTLQKTIYLMQSLGLNLGCVLKWYLHGTYCPTLVYDGYAMDDIASSMSAIPIELESGQAQRRYLEFKDYLDDKKYDPAMLDVSSAICYLDGLGIEKGEILELVKGKKPRFSAEQCQAAWDDLERYEVWDAAADRKAAAARTKGGPPLAAPQAACGTGQMSGAAQTAAAAHH